MNSSCCRYGASACPRGISSLERSRLLTRLLRAAQGRPGRRIRRRPAIGAFAARRSLPCCARQPTARGVFSVLDHLIARRSEALPLSAVTKADLKGWLAAQSDAVAAWVRAAGFKAEPGVHLLLPAAGEGLGGVLLGVESGADIWSYGGLPMALPEG